MTDSLPFTLPEPDASRPERKPRTHRHSWVGFGTVGSTAPAEWHCERCGRVRDLDVSRRGRSSDRLGKDQERRIERVYGPRKVGEFGDAVDHLGRDFKWQAKATRSLPPKWLAAITAPTHRDILPRSILDPMAHMAGIGSPRIPLVIRSYVRQGLPTRDWIFVVAAHWHRLHGRWPQFPEDRGYLVIPGGSFMDIHGRDEETG